METKSEHVPVRGDLSQVVSPSRLQLSPEFRWAVSECVVPYRAHCSHPVTCEGTALVSTCPWENAVRTRDHIQFPAQGKGSPKVSQDERTVSSRVLGRVSVHKKRNESVGENL